MTDFSSAQRIAQALLTHRGPLVLVAHVDPDGDALGSVLTLSRALRQLGRSVLAPMAKPPHYLRFLHQLGEICAPIAQLPADALLVVLDCSPGRVDGAPSDHPALVNIDHHASNDGSTGISWIDASYAAAALMVVEVVDALGVHWDASLATPALSGILTDTGHLRFANTDARVLTCAARLIALGVDYGELSDRLQWRHPDHFRMLGMVMGSVRLRLDGALILADHTLAMRAAIGDSEDDSDDFVQHYRYAEGTRVAAIIKERPNGVKLSVRSRGAVSARRICAALGGGGHERAAGALLASVNLAEAETRLVQAVADELARAAMTAPH